MLSVHEISVGFKKSKKPIQAEQMTLQIHYIIQTLT